VDTIGDKHDDSNDAESGEANVIKLFFCVTDDAQIKARVFVTKKSFPDWSNV
jgi:hypothetical protein